MSVLTSDQVKALNAFSRTHPHLAKVFGYTVDSDKEGLGDALNDGGAGDGSSGGPGFYGITVSHSDDSLSFRGITTIKVNVSNFYLTQNFPNTDEVQLNFRGSSDGGGTVEITFKDGTHTFTDDTVSFNHSQFYLTQDSAGNPEVNIIFPETALSSGQTPYFIQNGEIFTVEENKQVLHHRSIITDGQIIINGDLIEV